MIYFLLVVIGYFGVINGELPVPGDSSNKVRKFLTKLKRKWGGENYSLFLHLFTLPPTILTLLT